MHKRPTAFAAAVAAVLAFTAGCNSNGSPHTVAKPNPASTFSASAVANYMTLMHVWNLGPDQKVLGDSEAFCTKLRQEAPVADAVKYLESRWQIAGYALTLTETATGPRDGLCSDQHTKYIRWWAVDMGRTPQPTAS